MWLCLTTAAAELQPKRTFNESRGRSVRSETWSLAYISLTVQGDDMFGAIEPGLPLRLQLDLTPEVLAPRAQQTERDADGCDRPNQQPQNFVRAEPD